MITMILDTLLVFYYEKMVGYMPSNIANLVFAGERIEVGMRKGKFDYPALMIESLGQMERIRRREKPMLWLLFLHGQISH